MTVWAIVVAAGDGTRLAADLPKALVPLAGKPLLAWSLGSLARCDAVAGVVVACGESWKAEAEALLKEWFPRKGRVAEGGVSRQDSVRRALDRVPADTTKVLVHDAARPLADASLFARALFGLERGAGAVCAIPITDTVKRTNGDVIAATVERSGLWRAQTPQAFRIEALLHAHAEAARTGITGTDDAALLERAGEVVIVVPGDERNIKITAPGDLALAEALLETR